MFGRRVLKSILFLVVWERSVVCLEGYVYVFSREEIRFFFIFEGFFGFIIWSDVDVIYVGSCFVCVSIMVDGLWKCKR